MGWTSTEYSKATHTTLTREQAFEFLEKENRAYSFAAFHFVKADDRWEKNECYMILRHHEKQKPFILVTVMEIRDGQIFWKDIEETERPVYTNCPVKFFDFVPSPQGYATKWRQENVGNKQQFIPLNI